MISRTYPFRGPVTSACHSIGDQQTSRGLNSAFDTIASRLDRVANERPHDLAIARLSCEVDFEGLSLGSRHLAQYLLSKTRISKPTVAIVISDEIDAMMAIFAVARIGGVSANLDLDNPDAYLKHQVQILKPDIVLHDSDSPLPAAFARCVSIYYSRSEQSIHELDKKSTSLLNSIAVESSSLVGINFTSGTTGLPKAVARSHATALAGADSFAATCRISPEDSIVLFDSLCFAGGRAAALWTLLSGASLWVYPIRSKGIEGLCDWLANAKPTLLKCTPSFFRHFCRIFSQERIAESLRGLRILSLEGESCQPGDIDAFRECAPDGCVLRLTYSGTEFGNAAQCFITKDYRPDDRGVPAGFVNPGYVIKCHGQANDPADTVLKIAGPGVGEGYFGLPELTKERFEKRDSFKSLLFLTSDNGYVDSDGLLFIQGRVESQIKLRGFRLNAETIETAICEWLDVDQAVVTVRSFANIGPELGPERLVAYVVLKPGAALCPPMFRQKLHETLPSYAIPQLWVALDDIPIKSNGKFDLGSLPEIDPAKSIHRKRSYEPAQNTSEQQMVAIWEKALCVHPIDRHDHFEDLGGDSLAAFQIITGVETVFGVALPAASVLDFPTVALLVGRVQTHAQEDDDVCVLIKPGQDVRLYYVAPLQGDTLQALDVVRQLPSGTEVYGLQCHGLIRRQPALSDDPSGIVDMFVEKIKSHRPVTKIVLMGMSFGGVLAWQLSHALRARGIDVHTIILLDSYGPGCRRVILEKKMGYYVAKMMRMPARQATRYFLKNSLTLSRLLRSRLHARIAVKTRIKGDPKFLLTIAPKPMMLEPTTSDVVMIRAESGGVIEQSVDLGWQALTKGQFHLERTTGRHGESLTGTHGLKTAGIITRFLQPGSNRT